MCVFGYKNGTRRGARTPNWPLQNGKPKSRRPVTASIKSQRWVADPGGPLQNLNLIPCGVALTGLQPVFWIAWPVKDSNCGTWTGADFHLEPKSHYKMETIGKRKMNTCIKSENEICLGAAGATVLEPCVGFFRRHRHSTVYSWLAFCGGSGFKAHDPRQYEK